MTRRGSWGILLAALALVAASCDNGGFGGSDEEPVGETGVTVGQGQPAGTSPSPGSGTAPVEFRYVGVSDIEQVWLSAVEFDELRVPRFDEDATLLTSDLIPGDSLIGSGARSAFRPKGRDVSIHLNPERGRIYTFWYIEMPDVPPPSPEAEPELWSEVDGELVFHPGLTLTPGFEVGVNHLGAEWELVKETAVIYGPGVTELLRRRRQAVGSGGTQVPVPIIHVDGGEYEVTDDPLGRRFAFEQVYRHPDGQLYLFLPTLRDMSLALRTEGLEIPEDSEANALWRLLFVTQVGPMLDRPDSDRPLKSTGPLDTASDGYVIGEVFDGDPQSEPLPDVGEAPDDTSEASVASLPDDADGLEGLGPFLLRGPEWGRRNTWPESQSVKYDYLNFGFRPPRSDCPLELPDVMAFDVNPEIPDIVERWAPALHNGVDPANYAADLITRVDFDGNIVGRDNAVNRSSHLAVPAVYYSLVRGARHDFIGYYFYFPQDGGAGHDHDMEGVLLAYNRCTDHLDYVMTTQPGGLQWYGAPDAEPPPPADRVFTLREWWSATLPGDGLYLALALGIEAGSHTVWGKWDGACVIGPSGQAYPGCDDIASGIGVGFFYENVSRAPEPPFPEWPAWSSYPYSLIDIQGLWDSAHQAPSAGDRQLFAREDQRPPWDAFSADSVDTATLPWAWGPTGPRDHACTTTVEDMRNPNMFLDPAALFWPGPYFVHGYLDHPYEATSNCR